MRFPIRTWSRHAIARVSRANFNPSAPRRNGARRSSGARTRHAAIGGRACVHRGVGTVLRAGDLAAEAPQWATAAAAAHVPCVDYVRLRAAACWRPDGAPTTTTAAAAAVEWHCSWIPSPPSICFSGSRRPAVSDARCRLGRRPGYARGRRVCNPRTVTAAPTTHELRCAALGQCTQSTS